MYDANNLSYVNSWKVVIVFTIYYTYTMAIGIERRGRPYYVADIPFDNDPKMRLLNDFYKVTAKFHYREIMALSWCLHVNPSTVEKWKYRLTFPRWDIAVDVIAWAKRGKPMNLVYQRDKHPTMF